MLSPYYPFMSLTGRGRYFFPSRAKEAKKKKTPDLRLQLRTFLNYKVKVLFNWPSLYTNHEEKYR